MILYGVDPGLMTGFAVVEVFEDAPPEGVYCAHVPNGLEGWIEFEKTLSAPDAWFVEDYIPRPFTPQDDSPNPLKIIGYLHRREEPMTFQSPSGRKELVSNDVLKRLDLYVKGQEHALEAMRHIVVGLRKQGHMPTLRKGWPQS